MELRAFLFLLRTFAPGRQAEVGEVRRWSHWIRHGLNSLQENRFSADDEPRNASGASYGQKNVQHRELYRFVHISNAILPKLPDVIFKISTCIRTYFFTLSSMVMVPCLYDARKWV